MAVDDIQCFANNDINAHVWAAHFFKVLFKILVYFPAIALQ